MIHAFLLFRDLVPSAKLHVYALDLTNLNGHNALRLMLGKSLGVFQGWARDLRSVYRAADLLITPHRIYTRSIRESMACGLQVVSGRDVHPEDIETFAVRMAQRLDDPLPTRKMAEGLFDPARSAEAMERVLCAAMPQEAAVGD
jgi:glycosyltransferase involved in cell wall biosynthesis